MYINGAFVHEIDLSRRHVKLLRAHVKLSYTHNVITCLRERY